MSINIRIEQRYRDEDSDSIMRRFRRQMRKENIFEELEERRFYQKPSEVRHKAHMRRKRMFQKQKLEQRAQER
jgi:ribosomal protein S21